MNDPFEALGNLSNDQEHALLAEILSIATATPEFRRDAAILALFDQIVVAFENAGVITQ